jgi:hypothetical protein
LAPIAFQWTSAERAIRNGNQPYLNAARGIRRRR